MSNATSAGRLIVDLVARGNPRPPTLLLTGAAIWLTNVIVFALWYWEFDRGGPVERAPRPQPYPDFVFPQMTEPRARARRLGTRFVDYLYLSFTNATAFSPTDVMPMTRWAKLTMMLQSAISRGHRRPRDRRRGQHPPTVKRPSVTTTPRGYLPPRSWDAADRHLGGTAGLWSAMESPVAGRRRVEGVNLAGDDQADGRVHGGHDKAAYAYVSEDYVWWSSELGTEYGPGASATT